MSVLKVITPEKTIELTIEKELKKKVIASNSEFLYEGEVKSNLVNGKGILYQKLRFDKTEYYEGEFKKGFLIKGTIYNLRRQLKEYEGTFKNGKLHGKGKEYSDKDSYDEGTFKDGKLNGKGKEIYNGNVIYEGTYKDGLLNGKGKQYHDNKQLEYEGTYKNGRYNGKGKKYNNEGKIMYDGSFKDGLYDGKGKKYRYIVREGKPYLTYLSVHFKRRQEEGKGIEYNKNGKIIGKFNFKKGKKEGRSISYYDNGTIKMIGNWKNGELKRKKKYYENGKLEEDMKIESDISKGKKCDQYGYCEVGQFKRWSGKEGPFKIYYPDGKLMEKGNFNNNKREGLFSIYYENGKLSFKGYYKKNDKKGKGISYYNNGKIKYKGSYNYNHYGGKGKLYNEDGKLEKEGIFNYGYLSKGTFFFKDGSFMKGEFQNEREHGKVSIYGKNGKLLFKGQFNDGKKEGLGTEYNENGKVIRKGIWENDIYLGKKNIKEKRRNDLVEENNIKKFLQTNKKQFLKKVKTESMKNYLKKYARKEVKGTKPKLVKELELWRKEVKKDPKETDLKSDEPMVFDAYEGTDIPIKEFLEEENRVLLLDEKGHYFGAYLEQCEIIYECQKNRSWRDYIGKDDVHSMIQFNTAEGPKFYFTTTIEKDLKNGFNLFHFKTEPKDLVVLSKEVAAGGNIISALHCDPKDIIKLSKVIKKEKIGTQSEVKNTINFTY